MKQIGTAQNAIVLVADDDDLIRESLATFLHRLGHQSLLAKDGEEALHLRSQTTPDLILLDVRMPNLDGIATCRAMRSRWIDSRIPIIMLTGMFDSESVDLAFESGADDYVTKPIHWAILRQRIRILLERNVEEARIRYQATYDQLTDLPNRTLFLDRLQHAISLANRNQESLALLFIDLDHFKEINDTKGHAAGDELLRLVAQRLKNCVRTSDTLARLGGDEFTMILANPCQQSDPRIVAEKILSVLAQPFELSDFIAQISASIGVAFFPDDAQDLIQLLQNADQAMYQAKNLGRNRYCCLGAG
ncbi:MAG: diguanylate cyclase [Magnetococcales bacterium]|nr:diguanylate cyclase [Magnetococcales bacterium]